jgi:hypothetical protein
MACGCKTKNTNNEKSAPKSSSSRPLSVAGSEKKIQLTREQLQERIRNLAKKKN